MWDNSYKRRLYGRENGFLWHVQSSLVLAKLRIVMAWLLTRVYGYFAEILSADHFMRFFFRNKEKLILFSKITS